MVLSKKDKEQLISIEKCEREAQKQKLLNKLLEERNKITKPYIEKIDELKKNMDSELIRAGLYFINDGCGRIHPELEKFNHETNKIIKEILRE